ncbi:MAG: hypothetical protein QXU18_04840 [Thermoplasmatales archaeon]
MPGIDMDKLIFDAPLDFGVIYTARRIMDDTGMMRSLPVPNKYRETIFLMMAMRIPHPDSDISLKEVLQDHILPMGSIQDRQG